MATVRVLLKPRDGDEAWSAAGGPWAAGWLVRSLRGGEGAQAENVMFGLRRGHHHALPGSPLGVKRAHEDPRRDGVTDRGREMLRRDGDLVPLPELADRSHRGLDQLRVTTPGWSVNLWLTRVTSNLVCLTARNGSIT